VRFRTTILQAGKTATGIRIPPEVVAALGSSKRPPVRATINGYTYRSTIAVLGGEFMLGVSADVRLAAGVAGGDLVDIDLELDTAPREVTVPADFAALLDGEAALRGSFDGLSTSKRKAIVLGIEGAKTPETRQRRIDTALRNLRDGLA
jgi:Bacteriocin-protection, YdeI or OmpD-Associated/Domain of unknown function (DUF1905)